METFGAPWFVAVRHLGPPLFLLVVGGALLLWRRPRRSGLAWAALAVNLLAASSPFLWIWVQVLTGRGDLTVIGLVMTLLQPGLTVLAWLLLLWALVRPTRTPGGEHSPNVAEHSGETRSTPENVG